MLGEIDKRVYAVTSTAQNQTIINKENRKKTGKTDDVGEHNQRLVLGSHVHQKIERA